MVSGPRCPPGLWGLLALMLLPPLPGARGTCDSPPRLHFAELPGVMNNSYPVGTRLQYSCRPGYILSSGKSPFVTCLENSKWSVGAEFCVGRPCKPLELENGRVDLTDLRFGATANFSCNEGHRLIGATSAQCVLVGNGVDWDKEVPLCQAIPCLPPPDITDGSHNGQSGEDFSFGSAVTYRCDPGFSLIGEASIHCTTKDQVNGEWSGPAPECKVVKCPEPEVKNGKKQSGFGPDYSYGNTVIFECDSGYTLHGSSSVICEANNSWVPSLPTCLGSGTGTDKLGMGLGIGLGIGAVVIMMVGASILRQKKKSSFGVKPNLDSRKHHITTEHDFQMSETKSNLILKDNTSLGTGETAYLEAGNGTGLGKATSDTAVPRIC